MILCVWLSPSGGLHGAEGRSDVNPKLAARAILDSLPPHVLLVAAAKTRSAEEVKAAISAGVTAIGENYVQEAEAVRGALATWERAEAPRSVTWHLIGHLQRNKARKAVELFDLIETVDSLRIAEAIDRHCAELGKIMPILVEVNSGRESNKTGVPPHEVESLLEEIAELPKIRIRGLMTMGPRFGDPEEARPYFAATKSLFDRLATKNDPRIQMESLSMGMSNTYELAVAEGANIVRIGTKLFGDRPSQRPDP